MIKVTAPTFKEAFLFWLKLGFISFGGPAGQIAIMHTFLVDKKKWISDSRFLHALNYCMVLPGPEAQQLATYIGWLLHGTRGGLAAGILFVLPSMFILLVLSVLYVAFGKIDWVNALFSGLKPAVIAIILIALMKIGKKSLHSYKHYLIAAFSFVAIFFFNIPFPVIIFAAIIIGFILSRFSVQKKNENKNTKPINEEDYYINQHSLSAVKPWSLKNLLIQIATGLILWITPFIIFYYFTSDFAFWKKLSLFFTQAAFVTFGGAYAVLPYVAQVSVEKLNWLTEFQMIDGLALGETTPGPLIMVLTFVGFMAGYNSFNQSILYGSIGLITTTFYTFLPCFLFIFIGAPLIEKTRDNFTIKEILSFVTSAVVGVILNLTLYLGEAVIFPSGLSLNNIHYFNLIWILISFIFLFKYHVNMILWIGISALAGLSYYLVNLLF